MKSTNISVNPQPVTRNSQHATRNPQLYITESPRDAMQGLKTFIPTERKISYINSLLQVGFDIVDAGSFVSANAVPQMADTKEVINGLDLENSLSEIMVLVVNEKGAIQAVDFKQISILSFPFSVSPAFLKLNINSTTEKAYNTVLKINEIVQKGNKKFMCYLTMGFGNPYGDKWHPDIILNWLEKFQNEGIQNFNISDITGEANEERIHLLYSLIFNAFPEINIGIHLHTEKKTALSKIEAAWTAGVRQFDTVLNGTGGCPMTGYELLGNLDTMALIGFCKNNGIQTKINIEKLNETLIKIPY